MLAGGAGQRWRFELGARYAYYVLGQRQQNLRVRAGQALMFGGRFAIRAGVETAVEYAQATADLVAYY
jgi:hypothetical protein